MKKTKKMCVIDGCGKPTIARGLCEGHYRRWRRHGNPLSGGTATGAPQEFFFGPLLSHEGEDCLIWPFATHGNGYAKIDHDGKTHTASRLLCEVLYGPPQHQDMVAAHLCGRGHEGCINPKHLRWATRKENAADAKKHGTWPIGSKRWNAQITEEQVREIRKMRGSASHEEIGRKFGTTKKVVEGVMSGRNWSWVE